MGTQISFGIIRYVNIIKILQLRRCLQRYLEVIVVFSMFYLFDRKFAELFFFTKQNMRAQKIGCISEVLPAWAPPDLHRERNFSKHDRGILLHQVTICLPILISLPSFELHLYQKGL